jgi:hypothetical protein
MFLQMHKLRFTTLEHPFTAREHFTGHGAVCFHLPALIVSSSSLAYARNHLSTYPCQESLTKNAKLTNDYKTVPKPKVVLILLT